MVHWDMLAVVAAFAAFPFVVWPQLGTAVVRHLSRISRLIWKAGGRCDRLLWRDIPDGELHDCHTLRCTHGMHHEDGGHKCWEDILSVVFTRAWRSQARKDAFTRKPESLSFIESYLEIDYKVLMAFIFSTVGCLENFKAHFF